MNAAPQLILQPLSELLSAPVVPLDYTWSGRLVAGTVSMLVSKPKVGKSTLARNLCLAVARGESCLGWQCKQGTVIYMALEERSIDVVEDFRALGASISDPISVCDDSRTSIASLCELVRDKRPALVVVDPLQRLTRVRDGQSYAENYNALGPLVDAARESGSHIMLCHHSAKADREDSIDSPLGSTALAGAVSTVLRMRRTANFRSLCSVQRLGPDLAEVTLSFDPTSKLLALGELRESFELENLGKLILAALKDAPMSEPDLLNGIEAGAKLKRRELRKLVSEGQIIRTGGGKKGDPYLYQKMLVCSSSSTEKMPDEKVQEGTIEEHSGENNARLTLITCNETRKRESFDIPEANREGKNLLPQDCGLPSIGNDAKAQRTSISEQPIFDFPQFLTGEL